MKIDQLKEELKEAFKARHKALGVKKSPMTGLNKEQL
jgi:hypothetical protein